MHLSGTARAAKLGGWVGGCCCCGGGGGGGGGQHAHPASASSSSVAKRSGVGVARGKSRWHTASISTATMGVSESAQLSRKAA